MTIETAKLDWVNGEPRSIAFDDIYFSRGDGLEETRYVFLELNGLPQRWQDNPRFVIGETGFGTGLNFLATLQLWRRHKPPGGRLHFVSVEKFPLGFDDLVAAHARWPELAEEAAALQSVYPLRVAGRAVPPLPGLHRLFPASDVTLDLVFGDAVELIGELDCPADAWFLDGFHPACNEAMWSTGVFRGIANNARDGCTLSTFTVAGRVRRGLAEVGFEPLKRPGHGRKREVLSARFLGRRARRYPPWLARPAASRTERVAVIGAGIAGLTTCRALTRRGLRPLLIDAQQALAGASGNPAALIKPGNAGQGQPYGAFFLQAFALAIRELAQLDAESGESLWQQIGVRQRATSVAERQRWQRALAAFGSAWVAPLRQAADGLGDVFDLPLGGMLFPHRLLRAFETTLIDSGLVQARYGTPVSSLRRAQSEWLLLDADDGVIASVDGVVIANAMAAKRFSQTAFLPLRPARGQVDTFGVSVANASGIRTGDGYLLPLDGGRGLVGASFDSGDASSRCRDADSEQNRLRLSALLSGQWSAAASASLSSDDADASSDSASWLEARASVRATVADQLPLVGAVADAPRFRECFADLRHGRRESAYPTAPILDNLFVNVGLGAKGFTSAWLSAELLVAQMLDEPAPLSRSLGMALHPSRYLVRALRRMVPGGGEGPGGSCGD